MADTHTLRGLEVARLRDALDFAPWFVSRGPFTVERIDSKTDGVNWRIADADDNRVATCFDQGNANVVAAALNVAFGLLNDSRGGSNG